MATQRRALPLRQMTLIGVAGTPEARRALVRTPGGQIRQLGVGDSIRQGTVVAIAEDALTVASDTGRTTVLRMPTLPEPRAAA